MFNVLGAIGALLPGYMEGHRKAVQDNWNDLNQYNNVQKGQLDNMWTEDTYDMRYKNMAYNTTDSFMKTLENLRQTRLAEAQFGGQYAAAALRGQYLPALEQARIRSTYGQYNDLAKGKPMPPVTPGIDPTMGGGFYGQYAEEPWYPINYTPAPEYGQQGNNSSPSILQPRGGF